MGKAKEYIITVSTDFTGQLLLTDIKFAIFGEQHVSTQAESTST